MNSRKWRWQGPLSIRLAGVTNLCWLVVSTHLKNISQIGNLPQIGMKIKNVWNHHLVCSVPAGSPLFHPDGSDLPLWPSPSLGWWNVHFLSFSRFFFHSLRIHLYGISPNQSYDMGMGCLDHQSRDGSGFLGISNLDCCDLPRCVHGNSQNPKNIVPYMVVSLMVMHPLVKKNGKKVKDRNNSTNPS